MLIGVRRVASVIAAVLLVAGTWESPARAAPSAASGRYIVTLDGAGSDVAGVAVDLLSHLGGGQVVTTYQHALRGFVVDLAPAAAVALAALPGVAAVEPDAVMSVSTTQPNPPYGLDRIDQRDLPLSGTYEYTATGAGVRAYIIDTGIHATHQDFSGRVVPGVNTVDGSPSTQDCNGHGTHVAGTVGGETYGVAKDVTLVAVRVFGCANTTTTAAIISGVEWVVDDHDAGEPAVANMSLGGGASAALDAAVRAMIAEGVATAVASGNETTNGCNGSPGRVGEALTTGATDANDARASFSNWGACVDLHAPGVGVVSASPASNTATQSLSGTSMATPHVAGAAALYLQGQPGASSADVHSDLVNRATPDRISGIKTNCTFLDQLLGTCMAGTPNRLLYTGSEPAPPPPPPPPPPPCNALQRLLGLC